MVQRFTGKDAVSAIQLSRETGVRQQNLSLSCERLSSTHSMYAFTIFERTFTDFGLPRAIRTDNGARFASANSLFGLTRLSVWWLRLGIGIERIKL